jgi:glycosyltransferase involved in cell wall biosynthesis
MRVLWEGSFFANHSLALVNRELVSSLAEREDLSIAIRSGEPQDGYAWEAERIARLRARDGMDAGPTDVSVRHRWPLDVHPPASGKWVIFQPWEYGSLPRSWYEPMKLGADEVWVYSTFNKQSYIESGIPEEKIRIVPLGIHPELLTAPGQFPLRTRKRFKFLFVGGTILRKGIDLLIDSYIRTFTPDDDVCLVVKDFGVGSFYRHQTYDRYIRELQANPATPEIEYLADELTPEQLRDLYHACDCLVHPYRGEGFGLPIAEAMACGLPVMVPDQGGASDFCTPETALLLPSRRMRVPPQLAAGLETVAAPWWLEIHPEDLRARMREVYENPCSAREVARRGRVEVTTRFTWDAAANVAHSCLTDFKRNEAVLPMVGDPQKQFQLRVQEGVSAWDRGFDTGAMRHFGRALELNADTDVLYNLAAILFARADYRTSLRYLEQLIPRLERTADSLEAHELPIAEIHLLRALCHHYLGQAAAARRCLDAALQADPQHQDALALAQELKGIGASGSLGSPSPRIQWRSIAFNASGYAEETRSFLFSLLRQTEWPVRLEAVDAVRDRGLLPPHDYERLVRLTAMEVDRADLEFQHIPPTEFRSISAPVSIARTMFETDRISDLWVEMCNRFTEVWVPTHFNRETFARSGVLREKLRVVPGSLDTSKYDPSLYPRRRIRGAKGFTFVSVFDFAPRKGWDVLLHGYFQEFSSREDVSLVVKVITHHESEAQIHQRIRDFIRHHGYRNTPHLQLIIEYYSEAEMLKLYANADAFVLPSRGEGWGRPYMEAMAFGLPTIGTRWSGNTEFMHDENSYLVELDGLEPCERTWPEAKNFTGHLWASPSVTSTRLLMRSVYEDREEASRRGLRARQDIITLYDDGVVGGQFVREMERVTNLIG